MRVLGTVKDAEVEKPIPGARVSLYIGERELAVLYSDREGRFEHKEAAQYMGETLICQMKKEGFKPQKVTYKIEQEEVPLEIELVPEKKEKIELKPRPQRKRPKIAKGIFAVCITVIAFIFLGAFLDDKNGVGVLLVAIIYFFLISKIIFKSRKMAGTVIEKSFRPPPGAPDKYWCYLMIEMDSGKRGSIRLHQKHIDRVTIGDQIRFRKSWRKNKRVKNLEIVKRADL